MSMLVLMLRDGVVLNADVNWGDRYQRRSDEPAAYRLSVTVDRVLILRRAGAKK